MMFLALLLPCSALLAPASHRRRPRATLRAAAATWDTTTGPSSTLVAGGGPAGIATAIMLARRGWKNIRVCDRLEEPFKPDDDVTWSDAARFYLVGLGLRGQRALGQLDAWADVEKYCAEVVGRKDWAPGAGPDEGAERIFDDRPVSTQVIARDRLQGALYEVASTKYPEISFDWGAEVQDVAVDGGDGVEATLRLSDGTEQILRPPLVIGADGTARTVAMALEEAAPRRTRITRYDDDNERVFKTVPLDLPEAWRGDINYSARSASGRLNFDALPSGRAAADAKKRYCGVLLLKADDPLAQADSDPEELRALMDEFLPQFMPYVDAAAFEAVAKKPASRLPGFRFVGPRARAPSGLSSSLALLRPFNR
mmetsp:Transcript_1527/g.4685  ORF Transcript_1527/g.4685 Transcript_1527/m.4685 type:complete len:369 (-) Transcript_1527:14-1120(-)